LPAPKRGINLGPRQSQQSWVLDLLQLFSEDDYMTTWGRTRVGQLVLGGISVCVIVFTLILLILLVWFARGD